MNVAMFPFMFLCFMVSGLKQMEAEKAVAETMVSCVELVRVEGIVRLR